MIATIFTIALGIILLSGVIVTCGLQAFYDIFD